MLTIGRKKLMGQSLYFEITLRELIAKNEYRTSTDELPQEYRSTIVGVSGSVPENIFLII